MPWYYASPDGQPLGPLTQEELIAKRAAGEISPQTHILEQGGLNPPAWKRYQDVFPASPLPPVPALLAGTVPAASVPPPQPAPVRTNSWAVIGAVAGVMSLGLMPFCCIGTAVAIPGLLFSALGYYEVQRNQPHEIGKGVALLGFITSGISLLLFLGLIAWSFYGAQKGFHYDYSTNHFHFTPIPSPSH